MMEEGSASTQWFLLGDGSAHRLVRLDGVVNRHSAGLRFWDVWAPKL